MVCAPEIINVMPLAHIIMPRVAMKGGSLPLVIRMPFISPHKAPQVMPSIKPMETVSAGWKFALCIDFINRQALMLAKAATLPTERSMPAVIMTSNSPRHIIPMTEVL